MKRLTEQRAQELKAQGYTHIISICKSVYFTRYFKVAEIDACIGQRGIAGNRGIQNNLLVRDMMLKKTLDKSHKIMYNEQEVYYG